MLIFEVTTGVSKMESVTIVAIVVAVGKKPAKDSISVLKTTITTPLLINGVTEIVVPKIINLVTVILVTALILAPTALTLIVTPVLVTDAN